MASDARAHLLMNKELFFVNEEMCELLTGNQGSVDSIPVPDLYSSHEEADSRITLHCMCASHQPTTERVIVRSPDSDVFLFLCHSLMQLANRLSLTPAIKTTEDS
ncbi:hypothetical protein PoB_006726400 [Plakobranchus ocellatus]|uniref:Uncharacterized protein n=1 Tax=Plakobranchus ocellatus TaxID=259542 RepID=A0AAV4D9A2_9GAST|nr:hypothetical protein PoB_006726400 [Plakobranchus ocellatus]